MVEIKMSYDTAEIEVIGLCISLEAVGDMVNHALFELRDVSMYPGEVEVFFIHKFTRNYL